jgi:hypothetical protein
MVERGDWPASSGHEDSEVVDKLVFRGRKWGEGALSTRADRVAFAGLRCRLQSTSGWFLSFFLVSFLPFALLHLAHAGLVCRGTRFGRVDRAVRDNYVVCGGLWRMTVHG